MLDLAIASLLCDSPLASHTAASLCVAARLVGSPTYIGKMRVIAMMFVTICGEYECLIIMVSYLDYIDE